MNAYLGPNEFYCKVFKEVFSDMNRAHDCDHYDSILLVKPEELWSK